MDGLREMSRDLAITIWLLRYLSRRMVIPCHMQSGVAVQGAKHSPPGHKFQKSWGPRASIVETPFHQDSYGQMISE